MDYLWPANKKEYKEDSLGQFLVDYFEPIVFGLFPILWISFLIYIC